MTRAWLVLVFLIGLTAATVAASGGPGSGTLHWRTDRNQVDAQIEGWPLPTLLEEIATTTGWQVYAEPDTHHTVTTRFEKLATPEALRRLLNGLSFALLPQETGPSKLIVYRSSVDQATQRILGRARKGKSVRIADERLVVLKDGGDIDRLARRLGAKVVGRLDGVHAYRLRFDDAKSATGADSALVEDPEVESTEANYTIVPPATLEPIPASGPPPRTLLPDITPSADKVVVALIDTPVQPDGRLQEFLQAGLSVDGEYQAASGPLSHGTAMAETILDGVARAMAERGDTGNKVALSILPIDVYAGQEMTTTFNVAQGLYAALDNHVNVINLSLAGSTDSRLLRDLTQAAARRGVVIVAAAGNEPVTIPMYPAADPGVISVTASGPDGGVAAYANSGRWIDAMAPGENVIYQSDRAWYGTGTSFSSSWVSGWAAGYFATSGSNRTGGTQATLDRWRMPAAKP